MQTKWPQLSKFEYPGRFLIIGQTDSSYYAIYGVTARSESSRAKRYTFSLQANKISVEPTNIEVMSQGNLDLLQYNAAHIFNNAIVLGNGKQTNLIKINQDAVSSLASSLKEQTYEPDAHSTPRIAGLILNNGNQVSQAMHLIKSDSAKQPLHEAYDLKLQLGQAYFISTYSGENIRPTPSFNDNPILLDINFETAQDAAQQVYDYFAPTTGKSDLRVSIIAIQTDLKVQEKTVVILNYNK